jgi:hypothetical protein
MVGGLGHLHRDRADRRVDPLGLVAIGIALPPGAALVETGAEKALALDLHRQFEGPREHRGYLVRAMFDQMFQERLNRRILLPVHSPVSMAVSQLHGIPEWIAPAGAGPGRGSWRQRQMNFQTSGYSTRAASR